MNKKTVISFLIVLICISAIFMTVSADYKDNFSDTDYESNGWYYTTILGNPDGDYLTAPRRRISIDLPAYNTSLYLMNENSFAEDSTVEATFENVFSTDTSYGVICRYHDYGWYELRIVVAGEFAGTYSVYKYDDYLKSQGRDPYVVLHPGMDRFNSYDIKLGLNVKNALKISCEGDEIRVFINGNEQFPVSNGTLHDSDFTDGDAGIMVWNHPASKAKVDLVGFNAVFEEE